MDGQVPYLITVHFELHFGYRYGILLPVQETDFKSEVLDFYGWFFIWKPYDKTLENRKKFSLRINLDKIISPIISQSKWSDQNDLNNNLIWPILKNVLTLMSLRNNRLFDDVFVKTANFQKYSSMCGTSETFRFFEERIGRPRSLIVAFIADICLISDSDIKERGRLIFFSKIRTPRRPSELNCSRTDNVSYIVSISLTWPKRPPTSATYCVINMDVTFFVTNIDATLFLFEREPKEEILFFEAQQSRIRSLSGFEMSI